ncbi:retrotransposon protein, putative, ty1-copia subclass [Tanacetum coccineum]|uniref:Retrotransposon protein, putative, ty1-copia subclass n=1 Tax=Tanacetum coccineum TaxID=301880 RepID=A0ABQ5CRB4_9ASTR
MCSFFGLVCVTGRPRRVHSIVVVLETNVEDIVEIVGIVVIVRIVEKIAFGKTCRKLLGKVVEFADDGVFGLDEEEELGMVFSEDGISLIATQIGKSIMLDSFTSSMCIDSLGQNNFARCLIEVKADEVLKDSITMGILLPASLGFYKETIRVEYKWRPPPCEQCKIFGHVYDQCPKSATIIPTININNDGFQTVVNKKSGKTGSTSTDRDGVNFAKTVWSPFKPKDRFEPKAHGNSPKNGAPNVSTSAKDEFDPENCTNSEGDPNSILDDMESEEEVEVVFDETTNLLIRIASVAIIDRQLHSEYTIASRSTDVMVMALPVLNINHSAFRLMFEREKLSGTNFNDWFRSLKLVLRVEKKLFVIEQPIPPAPPADSTVQVLAQWNAVYDAHNEVACLMLGNLSIGLIMNGLTSDFAGFVRNYNMHNIRKTIGELHALLIDYEKGLPKKAVTPQVMVIQGELGHQKRNCPAYLDELIKKKLSVLQGLRRERKLKQGALYFKKLICLILCQNVNSIYNVSNKRAKHNLDSTYLWHCRLAHISKKRIEKPQHDGLLKSTDEESFDQCVSCLSDMCQHKVFKNEMENQLGKTIKALRSDRGGEYISQEFKDYLKACGIVQQLTPPYTPQHNVVSERRNRYPKETMSYYFYFPPENKIVVVRYAEFLEKNLISQEVSGRVVELKEIQDKDTSPSENTSEIPMEVEGFEPPQEEVVPVRRSARTHQALDRLCLNVEVEEHSLGDLNEHANYKAALLDLESDKWVDVVNAKMQSMKDNQVWCLVDLPPNLAKGYTQTYGVDYEETFSPVADIRAIRILIAIAAFYDYEIWKMDVKTAYLNGYLDEDIYVVQHEGFVDPNHPRKVCKLQRSIYSLKQASRNLNKRFKAEIKRMDTSKRDYISMQERLDLNKTQGASKPEEVKRMQNVPYALANPGEPHSTAVKTILKYLRNTKDIFLVYGENPKAGLRVDCYCDAYRDDIKSQT